ncbi:Aminopeptidase S [Rosistilla carotiformis]|uniref:Aminopeptidase S n=1 Tax=Rosistilla carotiformis TaxID=2528017 RepID=A0A518JSI4_9BACT|nr:M20/M25/M40 family metallo-hydrolase [Rosistilla carotiformis]QDV68500.1 Aminopeptidase S [Rosistilla carotiformis]
MLYHLLRTVSLVWFATLADAQVPEVAWQRAAERIDQATLRGHVRFLADDLLEGRGPGTRGDRLAQRYLQAQFQAAGLQPVLGDTWYQPVPLVGVKTHCPPTMTFSKGDTTLSLNYFDDYIATAGRAADRTSVEEAEVVFVGYGIEAPEFDWDDYKDVDLTGKVLLMLNNDPADDPDLFAGRRRLYYGRWDYKYQSAAMQGAAGAIIIHTTASAGYPFQVVQTSWSGEEFQLADSAAPPMELRGWVSARAAERLVEHAGMNLDDLRAAAERRDFRPIALGTRLSMDLPCEVRKKETANVLGMLPGSDPLLSEEVVVFMAHHDHIGLAEARDETGDNIYNGAVDNASGCAAMLAILKACTELEVRPRRSILFAAVGAEEQGLLGSKYFAEHPPVAPGRMAAVINIDGMNVIGRTHDVNMIGHGKSDLDAIVTAVAAWQQRIVTPDQFPDRGYYYRSDQFSLAQIGVPGVYLHSGINVVGMPSEWGKQRLEQWIEETYHQRSDEYRDDWDLSGAVEDIRLLFYVAMQVATADKMPAWRPGDEFESARKKARRAILASP